MDALCDLGASVGLMPYSIAKSLNVGDLKPTRMSLQFADRTVRLPLGILEDVPVQVGRDFVPCDFVVMEMEEDTRVPLTLEDLEEFQEGLYERDPSQAILTGGLVEEGEEARGYDLLLNQPLIHDVMKCEVLDVKVKEERTTPPLKVELKPLSPLLKYAFLDDSKSYPVIINAKLDDTSLEKLLVILREYRSVIGYKIDDIKGISPTICMDKILLDDDHASSIEHQRRLNPNMKEVVKKEVLKLLEASIVYPISDSKWVSPVQVLPKKRGMTIIKNDKGETISTRMSFGLCNAPSTFQRCKMSIFSDMLESSIEVFMDDFSVFGSSFDTCLSNLVKVLKRCQEVNLVLNWEKCHFMVEEGIVLGHVISSRGIEVDRAKIEVIEHLLPPTNVKGIRSFLGHEGFNRRFIKDFSKIAKSLTQLLVKDTPFVFSNDCLLAFDWLKEALILAPIRGEQRPRVHGTGPGTG
ncbi:uncharacterized protein LOC110717023 [Chenopodium quinoa]|uniref:uncharacterized protein LOC110717023 n=1 Tax=Chenopodium quinoa TaxID=63459 RepID=UPI000B78518E|nr:uncharacterized protein LOC110717023 [Chenopodium quinoa]